ncbi:MAG: carbon starvation protein A [Flammeovirgaceae bacterium]|nr:carbon starvation protein A [Flammeovirgaceae bacterium]
MTPQLVATGCIFIYFLGYRFYSKAVAGPKGFSLDDSLSTPAHEYRDNIDFIPTPTYILFGHHYASIAGLGPILGPAVAVIWGWLPALAWVVLGTIFIGAVHDFAALVLSARAGGKSIGSLTETLIGKRAKVLFMLIIFFLVSLSMGVFALVVASLFTERGYPHILLPSGSIMIIAIALGLIRYKIKYTANWPVFLSFLILLILIYSSSKSTGLIYTFFHENALSANSLKYILLSYALAASILPVWLLLQSRDFLNSLFLILGLLLLYSGFYISDLHFSAPVVRVNAEGAPQIFPFVFIIIACGSISGFHALVSSGTSSKQLNKETDARPIGYGGMLGESLLGLIAIFATTCVFSSQQEWLNSYGSWNSVGGLAIQVNLFINGCGKFLASLGLNQDIGLGLISFIVVSFALTSLDSGTRLLRYNLDEFIQISPFKRYKAINNRYVTSILAVLSIGFFAFFEIKGQPSGKALWQLFATTNQLLGALTLLVASIYLLSRNKNPLFTFIPMILVLVTTVIAMVMKTMDFAQKDGAEILMIISAILLLFTAWLCAESIIALKQIIAKPKNTTAILDDKA